jgi:hypothetical protein
MSQQARWHPECQYSCLGRRQGYERAPHRHRARSGRCAGFLQPYATCSSLYRCQWCWRLQRSSSGTLLVLLVSFEAPSDSESRWRQHGRSIPFSDIGQLAIRRRLFPFFEVLRARRSNRKRPCGRSLSVVSQRHEVTADPQGRCAGAFPREPDRPHH